MPIDVDSFVFPHGEYPPKGTLASYTDRDGYTVRIDALVDPDDTSLVRRYGTMFITDPDGNTIKAGYWMNWPEKEWKITPTAWVTLTWVERATLEVKHQATAYGPLKKQFVWDLGHSLEQAFKLVIGPILQRETDERILVAVSLALKSRGFTQEHFITAFGLLEETD